VTRYRPIPLALAEIGDPLLMAGIVNHRMQRRFAGICREVSTMTSLAPDPARSLRTIGLRRIRQPWPDR
jgi:hypothetical protein